MNYAVVAVLIVLGCGLTLYRGTAMAFAWLYLPIVLLLSAVPPWKVPGVLHMTATNGVIYGILLGLVLKGGEPVQIRWNIVDALVLLLAGSSIITAMHTAELWTGVDAGFEVLIGWVAPYFLARQAMLSAPARQAALRSLIVGSCVFAVFVLIEARLWPYFYGRPLERIGLYGAITEMAYHRYGLMRAQASFSHPIDLGNASLIIIALMVMLASTTRAGLRDAGVRIGLGAAACGVVFSISFTCYAGALTAGVVYLLLTKVRAMRSLLVPMVLTGIGAGIVVTSLILSHNFGDMPSYEEAMQNSLWVRGKIVQESWKVLRTAGAFGYGTITTDMLNLASVDNAYMLSGMKQGWVYLILLLLVPLGVAYHAGHALRNANLPTQRVTLAAGVATVLGIMAAMYTVWFGFAYAILWFILLGATMTVIDVLLAADPRRQMAARLAAPTAIHGFLGSPN